MQSPPARPSARWQSCVLSTASLLTAPFLGELLYPAFLVGVISLPTPGKKQFLEVKQKALGITVTCGLQADTQCIYGIRISWRSHYGNNVR